ncbi:MAG: hypothetical protein K2P67_07150 [Gallionellaceae bacterium]|nr:hypothetical protein [Gallionellaceae bacterium]
MSAETLATANRLFAEAKEALREGNEKLSSITERLSLIRTRLSEITQARVAGTATGQEADEFVLLTADADLLAHMQTDAHATVQDIYATVNDRQNELQAEEKNHALEQAGAEFMALSDKTREIESMLMQAISATHSAGKKLGHYLLSQSWRPSEKLDRAMRYGVPPEGL